MESKKYEEKALQKSIEHLNCFKDNRVRKPKLLLTETDINKQLKIPTNQLKIDIKNNDIVIQQANDIALYINISKKFLQIAEKQQSLMFNSINNFPRTLLARENEALEAYDYIENIITSIIFSYSAIEAFANTCISYLPDNFSFKGKNKTEILGNQGANLQIKLKSILKDFLQTPNPCEIKKGWWDNFIELENVRNEIIHTKELEAEKRYSKFFNKEIFKWIKVSEDILRFYGEYINMNNKELLIEFPYGYGFDSTSFGFINEENHMDFEKKRRGIL